MSRINISAVCTRHIRRTQQFCNAGPGYFNISRKGGQSWRCQLQFAVSRNVSLAKRVSHCLWRAHAVGGGGEGITIRKFSRFVRVNSIKNSQPTSNFSNNFQRNCNERYERAGKFFERCACSRRRVSVADNLSDCLIPRVFKFSEIFRFLCVLKSEITLLG